MLLVLVERAGSIVEKDELLAKVWPGIFVEEGNLSRRVFNLRQVLGDTEDGRKYIETIPTRGYRFVAAVEADIETPPEATSANQQIQTPPPRPTTLWFWPLLVTVLLAALAIVGSRYLWPKSAPQKIMLAVLPFENLSGDSHDDYFADGLTEEMIARLGQLQPNRLGVIARTSAMHYKKTQESAAQISRELGVNYLLEGSVRQSGDRVRITAQLIQATDQTHLWAENYERPLSDILSIQRDIAERITGSLSIQLLPAEKSAAAAANRKFNLESFNSYVLGVHALGTGTRDGGEKAIQYFQEAIAKDPNDPRLYVALGEAYVSARTYYSSPKDTMPQARDAALHAIQLDPNLASAHSLLADVKLFFDWDWPAAEKEYLRALELNPNLPAAQLGYSDYLSTLGRSDEALARVQQAYLLDPLAVETRNEALWEYYFSGRMQDTIEQAKKVMELEPTAGLPYAMLALANARLKNREQVVQAAELAVKYADSPTVLTTTASALAEVGETARATQVLNQALEEAKTRYVCQFTVATAHTDLGDNEKAFAALELAFLQRST
jgi:TolB-like protein/Tfp pilus assembly protein PilF